MIKEIESILTPPPPHMVGDGFRVHNFFPGGYRLGLQRMSPFFFLDYASKFYFSPSLIPKGVGPHPHRGIETVTIAYHGKVSHHDSQGNHGIIEEGDVQWMTAGKGILHKEYHADSFTQSGGFFQMVQLWVNLPAKNKMTEPKYQELKNNKLGRIVLPNHLGKLEVIAGNFQHVTGPAKTFSKINIYNIYLNKNGNIEFNLPENYNTGILIIEGEVKFENGMKASQDNFVLFKNNGEKIFITAMENSIFLILSGEPLNETIASHGPFVMNTEQEIDQAYDDFYSGKFGLLV